MLEKNLIKELFSQGSSYSDLAIQFDVSRQRIHQIVKDYRNYGRSDREEFYKNMDICIECKKEKAQELHHKDFDNNNDTKENLEALCKGCHRIRHGRYPMNRTKWTGDQRELNAGEVRCQNCGYFWLPRVKHPIKCPYCLTRKWDEPKEKHENA